jgi:hypothetical protein
MTNALKKAAVAAAVALACSVVQAAPDPNYSATSWGARTAGSFNMAIATLNPGSFSNTYSFTIANSEQSASAVGAMNLKFDQFSFLDITHGSYGLYTSSDQPVLGASWSFNGTTDKTTNFATLGAGSYYFKVQGTADGIYGGSYTIATSVAAVPEPETYAMMLAGLGLMGFIARRRKQR